MTASDCLTPACGSLLTDVHSSGHAPSLHLFAGLTFARLAPATWCVGVERLQVQPENLQPATSGSTETPSLRNLIAHLICTAGTKGGRAVVNPAAACTHSMQLLLTERGDSERVAGAPAGRSGAGAGGGGGGGGGGRGGPAAPAARCGAGAEGAAGGDGPPASGRAASATGGRAAAGGECRPSASPLPSKASRKVSLSFRNRECLQHELPAGPTGSAHRMQFLRSFSGLFPAGEGGHGAGV